ncbi:MAG TPA: helix-turn-helix domain-containing protein [Candidatus Hypogeohydataceae bacterium YC41]
MHLRAEKGWNRSEAARRANIPISTYQAFEKLNRKPKGEAAMRLSRIFGVTLDYLMDDERGYPPGPLDRVSTGRPKGVEPTTVESVDLSMLPENFRNYLEARPEKLKGLTKKDLEELSTIRGYGGVPVDPAYWIDRHVEENEALERCKKILLGSNRKLLLAVLEVLSKE